MDYAGLDGQRNGNDDDPLVQSSPQQPFLQQDDAEIGSSDEEGDIVETPLLRYREDVGLQNSSQGLSLQVSGVGGSGGGGGCGLLRGSSNRVELDSMASGTTARCVLRNRTPDTIMHDPFLLAASLSVPRQRKRQFV